MRLISHRGNVDGVIPEKENSLDYIDSAIGMGFDVEIDLWKIADTISLGHDEPQYQLDLKWLTDRRDKLWVHCKNLSALSEIVSTGVPCFYHVKEDYTLISNGKIWAHNINTVNENCIIPLLTEADVESWDVLSNPKVYGICSDFVRYIND